MRPSQPKDVTTSWHPHAPRHGISDGFGDGTRISAQLSASLAVVHPLETGQGRPALPARLQGMLRTPVLQCDPARIWQRKPGVHVGAALRTPAR